MATSSLSTPAAPSVEDQSALQLIPRTFNGNSNALSVVDEVIVDFDNGFDLRSKLKYQGWESYLKMLNGPCYNNLVKVFWKQHM
ncbi:hypothetical protein A2U01_0009446 [Trifolium medium]|uniref:Cullin-like protein n=1 Tax=Trifolium medium TaxID=97028 RepID=A0A392MN76_9FABA|nr:hypothetical protein [Trifolium medium]